MQMIDHYLITTVTTGCIACDEIISLGYIQLSLGNMEAWKKKQRDS